MAEKEIKKLSVANLAKKINIPVNNSFFAYLCEQYVHLK